MIVSEIAAQMVTGSLGRPCMCGQKASTFQQPMWCTIAEPPVMMLVACNAVNCMYVCQHPWMGTCIMSMQVLSSWSVKDPT